MAPLQMFGAVVKLCAEQLVLSASLESRRCAQAPTPTEKTGL